MQTLGFTEEQTERMIRVRRILPFVDESTAPSIDARQLWENIGNPHGQFNKWIEQSAEGILDDFIQNGEVLEIKTQTGRRPRADYTISRDCAVHLAMNARTPQGKEVRSYFIDMEKLAMRLHKYTPIRGSMLTEIDNQVAHQMFIIAGEKAKSGELPKSLVSQKAMEMRASLMSLVSRVMTGLSASEWRAKIGRPIRDSLTTDDLNQYSRAYDSALTMLAGGMTLSQIEAVLNQPYGNSVDPSDYIKPQAEVA